MPLVFSAFWKYLERTTALRVSRDWHWCFWGREKRVAKTFLKLSCVFKQLNHFFLKTKKISGRSGFPLLIYSNIVPMFSLNLSYVAILRDVARRCRLPYVSSIHEVIEDGNDIYGIEVQLPPNVPHGTSQTLFFWADPGLHHALAYEASSLQALVALQAIYGFVVVDYSLHGLQLYRSLAQRLFPVANRGTQLARLVVAASQEEQIPFAALIPFAQQLLDDVASIPHHCML